MHVNCWVHIFSGLFGSFGLAVNKRTRNNWKISMALRVEYIFSSSFGSVGSAVDERTRSNCMQASCKVFGRL